MHLTSVMRSYGACGLSGPQIGLPWQIFVIEYTKEHMKTSHEVIRKIHEESIIPLTVFINPELKILEITALNASAEKFSWRARGWSARIAQHEYDHLQVRFPRRNKETYSYL